MKTRNTLSLIARLLFATLAGSMFLNSCAETDPNKPSDIPWNQQEPWEGSARYGNFPQSR